MNNIHRFIKTLTLVLVLAKGNQAEDNDELRDLQKDSQLEQIQSPMLEVLMHVPPNFRDVQSFKNFLGIKPQRIKRKTEGDPKGNGNIKSIVDVRSYEVAQPGFSVPTSVRNRSNLKRNRREAKASEPDKAQPILENPEKLVSSLVDTGFREKYSGGSSQTMLPMPDAIRGPIYTTYPVKEFDMVDIDDPDDPRRRRNDSSDSRDDNSQRDKRTFMEGGGEGAETTTPLPFWKRKKENPPFITGRGGPIQNGNTYTPPQHRSAENARESHSMKNLDKPVQSNEIPRNNQDNYYASTNRRTYSRQSDNVSPSTPKSVYDTIDYSSNGKRNQDTGRTEFGRNYEGKKETLRDGRPTHEQYNNRPYLYNHPSVYDRSFYHPPYPYPTEVVGRGVEYYHRTYDPTSGRIIYYANMPEHGRSYDYRFMDPINRNFYIHNRPYFYDPYYRNYVPPFDYRFPSGFGRSVDYMRTGRSSSQAYSYPYTPGGEKFPRDARFNGAFDKTRLRDDSRNKTYIIYDADENRSKFPRTQYPPDGNRLGYTPTSNTSPGPQVPQVPQAPFRNYPFPPSGDYFPQAGPFPFRNQFYPSSPASSWGYNQRPGPGVTDSNVNSRPINPPNVQLPLTTSHRALQPSGDLDKNKKS